MNTDIILSFEKVMRDHDVVKNQLLISFREAAASSELGEDLHTTKVLVDKNGQLLDIV